MAVTSPGGRPAFSATATRLAASSASATMCRAMTSQPAARAGWPATDAAIARKASSNGLLVIIAAPPGESRPILRRPGGGRRDDGAGRRRSGVAQVASDELAGEDLLQRR